jgi:hypothetical protein
VRLDAQKGALHVGVSVCARDDGGPRLQRGRDSDGAGRCAGAGTLCPIGCRPRDGQPTQSDAEKVREGRCHRRAACAAWGAPQITRQVNEQPVREAGRSLPRPHVVSVCFHAVQGSARRRRVD